MHPAQEHVVSAQVFQGLLVHLVYQAGVGLHRAGVRYADGPPVDRYLPSVAVRGDAKLLGDVPARVYAHGDEQRYRHDPVHAGPLQIPQGGRDGGLAVLVEGVAHVGVSPGRDPLCVDLHGEHVVLGPEPGPVAQNEDAVLHGAPGIGNLVADDVRERE